MRTNVVTRQRVSPLNYRCVMEEMAEMMGAAGGTASTNSITLKACRSSAAEAERGRRGVAGWSACNDEELRTPVA